MLERVTRLTEAFFADVDADLVQQQREALIDLLIWTMLVDGHSELEEQEHLASLIDQLHWDSPLQVNQYLGMAYSRVRSALSPGESQPLLASIRQRLQEPAIRQRAYRFACDLAESDGDRSPEELRFLQEIERAFAG